MCVPTIHQKYEHVTHYYCILYQENMCNVIIFTVSYSHFMETRLRYSNRAQFNTLMQKKLGKLMWI